MLFFLLFPSVSPFRIFLIFSNGLEIQCFSPMQSELLFTIFHSIFFSFYFFIYNLQRFFHITTSNSALIIQSNILNSVLFLTAIIWNSYIFFKNTFYVIFGDFFVICKRIFFYYLAYYKKCIFYSRLSKLQHVFRDFMLFFTLVRLIWFNVISEYNAYIYINVIWNSGSNY